MGEMEISYWLEAWLGDKKQTKLANLLAPERRGKSRQNIRFWEETDHWGGGVPPFHAFLDRLESLWEPLHAQSIYGQQFSFCAELGLQAENRQLEIDPYSLLQMGEEGIRLSIRERGLGAANWEKKNLLNWEELTDLWIEESESKTYLFVAFEDRSLWKTHIQSISDHPASLSTELPYLTGPQQLFLRSMELSFVGDVVLNLLAQGAFPQVFRSYEEELGLLPDTSLVELDLCFLQEEPLPQELQHTMVRLGLQTIELNKQWQAGRKWETPPEISICVGELLADWQLLRPLWRRKGLSRHNISLRLRQHLPDQKALELRPELLTSIGKLGLHLQVEALETSTLLNKTPLSGL